MGFTLVDMSVLGRGCVGPGKTQRAKKGNTRQQRVV